MPVWSSATILRFQNQAEEMFCSKQKCLIDRVCLDIVSGTSLYTLPESCIDIRRVTWKGLQVYPQGHRTFRESQLPPAAEGRPIAYIYSNVGANVIKLYPAPNETIATTTTGLFSTSILTKVIVEYYRAPDFSTFRLPSWMRRRLLKAYVNKMCYAIEGKGQNLKAAQYFGKKWEYQVELFSQLLIDYMTRPRQILMGSQLNDNSPLVSARLPVDRFGIGLNLGE